ncbi:hypothetical protein OROMI_028018 [Orobanche minor]
MRMCMENILPSEIILEILSRLPADSVLQCRQVCKTWRNLLRHPSFAHMHLCRLSQLHENNYHSQSTVVVLGFLLSLHFSNEHGTQLYYGEYDSQPDKKLRRINQPPIHHSIIGSCNGLICISEFEWFYRVNEPLYICNPVTGEYINFPRPKIITGNKVDLMVCGFGYDSFVKKYKIVRIYYIKDQPLGRVQVYTLGGGGCSGWRDVGEATYSLRLSHSSYPSQYRSTFGVFANGAVHWLDNEERIVSINLADEKLYLLPSPPFVRAAGSQNTYQLHLLGGCLCFGHHKRNDCLDIWFLRKKDESSIRDMSEMEYDSSRWSKKFSIAIEDCAEPFALTSSGEVLLHYASSIFCYDPRTRTLEKIVSDGVRVCRAIPHANSFVSLKALGEKCKFRKRYDINPAAKVITIQPRRKDNGAIDA